MAELADARDLKSREINFSYRFDPGFRHQFHIAEWSSLVARRAHNPEVMRFKSHLRNQKRKQSIGLLFRFWNDVFRKRNVMRTSCVMTASPCDVRCGAWYSSVFTSKCHCRSCLFLNLKKLRFAVFSDLCNFTSHKPLFLKYFFPSEKANNGLLNVTIRGF